MSDWERTRLLRLSPKKNISSTAAVVKSFKIQASGMLLMQQLWACDCGYISAMGRSSLGLESGKIPGGVRDCIEPEIAMGATFLPSSLWLAW